jgi:hypothetical protein
MPRTHAFSRPAGAPLHWTGHVAASQRCEHHGAVISSQPSARILGWAGRPHASCAASRARRTSFRPRPGDGAAGQRERRAERSSTARTAGRQARRPSMRGADRPDQAALRLREHHLYHAAVRCQGAGTCPGPPPRRPKHTAHRIARRNGLGRRLIRAEDRPWSTGHGHRLTEAPHGSRNVASTSAGASSTSRFSTVRPWHAVKSRLPNYRDLGCKTSR